MTNLLLLNVPITDLKNQILFSNDTAQENYFKSKKITNELDNEEFSYIEKENLLKVPFSKEEIYNCNYIMYQNLNYSDKWHYCFVTNLKYENDGLTYLTIKEDVFQTWFLNCTIHPCFVEREHVSNDTIGANTIEENLDIGEVIEETSQEDISLSQYFWVAMETNWILNDNSTGGTNDGKQFDGISVYNRQVSGNKIILFKINNLNDYLNVALYILRANYDGHIDDVKNLYIVPSAVINESGLTSHTAYAIEQNKPITFYTMPFSNSVEEIAIQVNKVTSFSNLTIKNNKCFVYPYNYLFVTNNNGNHNIFKYENFSGNKATFKIILALTIGMSGKLIPTNYKNMNTEYDESIPLGKYPTCGWSSDAFTNWLTKEAVNESSSLAFGLIGAGNNYRAGINNLNSQNAKLLEKNPNATLGTSVGTDITLGINIAQEIAHQIGNFYSGSLMPNIQGGNNSGNVVWASNKNTFTFKCMRVKNENIKIIDDFFSEFGYKINRVKVPETHSRENWNYIKTIDINITGNVPLYAIEELKNMFNNGCTLWHNANNIFNYNLSNNII